MKKGIVEVLQTEMLDFMAPVIVNNLPSIDGLLNSQRQVIWGMDKAKMNSNGQFYKMLKASGRIFDYYVLGDMPLCGVMKNMANNYILNKYLMPKGSFGNKNHRNSKGSAPRYIECKLGKYGEYMLQGINKNAVPMKDNYDATEKEPVIMPSKVPNILTNLRMSIAVSESNTMPSHNMNDTCDSIISYIKTKDIDKSIELIKVPDLPSGGRIIYDKDIFNKIYKTGKGSFTIIGKYKYDEKKNTMTIYEIPYTTYIENIEDEIEDKMDKVFKNVLSDHPQQGSDKDGLKLILYLKKGIDCKYVEKLLRNHTSYEDKFSCNFTILDLDGKTPILMSLEDIITKWLVHRTNCIKNEINYDISIQQKTLNKYLGLQIIDADIENVVKKIRNTKQSILIEMLMNDFNLNKEQAEYIKGILLSNINKEWIKERTDKIDELKELIKTLETNRDDENYINNVIINELEECKTKFGKDRLTDIIYEDNNTKLIKEDLIEDFNCRIMFTSTYIKKHQKKSESHNVKEGEAILGDIETTNKSTLLIFTDKANRYKIPVYELETYTPSKLGDYVYNILPIDKDEKIIKVVSVKEPKGFIYTVYENGCVGKVDIKSYLSNNKKLQNCYNTDSKLLDLYYSEKDIDIFMLSSEGKAIIINTENINSKASRNTKGIRGIKLSEGFTCIGCIMNICLSSVFLSIQKLFSPISNRW